MSVIYTTILIYLIVLVSIIFLRPRLFYNNNQLKTFGIGKNQTILPLFMASVIIIVIIHLLNLSCHKMINKI